MTVLKDNVSVPRILSMWNDEEKFYNENKSYVCYKEYIRGIIAGHLKEFWGSQLEAHIRMSDAKEIINFIYKHESKKAPWYKRAGKWIDEHLAPR
jgi:hypothetical protein